MNNDIIEKAKNIIYNSNIMLYVPKEKVDIAFLKIHMFNNEEEFFEAYGKDDYYKGGRLEGFNKNHESFIGPEATVHTVIHEVLHELSSEFDRKGHRLKNGIMGYDDYMFANQINEGCTDYIAAKLSGEEPRNYIQGHKFFNKIEPMLIKYSDDPDIMLKMYLDKDTTTLSVFLDSYGGKGTFQNLYENFLFMDDDKINNMLNGVEKNLNKEMKKIKNREKIENLIDKIKNIFRKDKVKALPSGEKVQNIDEHKKFVDKYDINNFDSAMPITKEEKKNNQKQNDIEIEQEEK